MKIIVTIPMRDGQLHQATSLSLQKAYEVALRNKWGLERLDVVGQTVVPFARNSLISQALAMGADKIVMLDDDVSFTGKQFETLVTADASVVTGNYPMRPLSAGEQDLAPTATFNKNPPATSDKTLTAPVDRMGFGFCCVDRKVFGEMAPRAPLMKPTSGLSDMATLFFRQWLSYALEDSGEVHPVSREPMMDWLSADVAFARALTKMGKPPVYHHGLQCGHHYGPLTYRHFFSEDEQAYYEKEMRDAAKH